MSQSTFGSRLQALREAQGITRRDLAARAGIAPGYLEKLERGYNAPPSAATITRLTRSLRCDADELFSLAEKIAPDLEHDLKTWPLLVQVLRLASTWSDAELRTLLRVHGVPEEKLQAASTCRRRDLEDERRCTREPITAELKRAIFKTDGFECVYCSAQAILEVDHIHPHSLGGTNEPENLVTCCHKCNKKKSNRTTPFPMVFGRFRSEIEST